MHPEAKSLRWHLLKKSKRESIGRINELSGRETSILIDLKNFEILYGFLNKNIKKNL